MSDCRSESGTVGEMSSNLPPPPPPVLMTNAFFHRAVFENLTSCFRSAELSLRAEFVGAIDVPSRRLLAETSFPRRRCSCRGCRDHPTSTAPTFLSLAVCSRIQRGALRGRTCNETR